MTTHSRHGLKSFDKNVSQSTTFRFLALPAEIRNMVYRRALIPTTPEGIEEVICTLAHPPLVRVSRQLRAETLPIYYGENEFALHIGASSSRDLFALLTSEQDYCAIDAAYKRHIAMFEAISPWDSGALGNSCISHIKRISITHGRNSINKRHRRYYASTAHAPAGFLLGAPRPAWCKPSDRVRICQGVEDWDDFATVRAAFLDEMDAWVSNETKKRLSKLIPMRRMTAILWFCAKECPLAARHVEFWCDELSHCRRVGSES